MATATDPTSPPTKSKDDAKPAIPLPRSRAEWLTLVGLVGMGVYHASNKDYDGLMAVVVAGAGLYGLNAKQGRHSKTLAVLAAMAEQTQEHLEDIRNNPAMPGTPVDPKKGPTGNAP